MFLAFLCDIPMYPFRINLCSRKSTTFVGFSACVIRHFIINRRVCSARLEKSCASWSLAFTWIPASAHADEKAYATSCFFSGIFAVSSRLFDRYMLIREMKRSSGARCGFRACICTLRPLLACTSLGFVLPRAHIQAVKIFRDKPMHAKRKEKLTSSLQQARKFRSLSSENVLHVVYVACVAKSVFHELTDHPAEPCFVDPGARFI